MQRLRKHKSRMGWVRFSTIQRCANGAQRMLARSVAAPLPVRLSIAGAALILAIVPRLALSPALGQDVAVSASYLAIGVAGLLGGAIPGACALTAIVMASYLWPEAASLGNPAAVAFFLANAALLLTLEEALHQMRRRSLDLVMQPACAPDLTSYKRVEASSDETASRLQARIDAAPDAVFLIAADGQIRTSNGGGVEMFGYSEQEIVGRHIDELLASSKKGSTIHPASCKNHSVQARRRSGKAFPAEMTITETAFEGQSLRLVFIKDLSETREFAHRIGESHRDPLDAMGMMAAALAHEINQPLAANATYLRVAQRLLEKSPNAGDPALIEILGKAAAQTLRAGRIVASVKDMARGREPDKTRLGVHEVIHEAAAATLEDCARAAVKIEIRCEAACDDVVADRAQLRQAIGNLIRSSIAAMQSAERKELVISTRNPDDHTINVDVIDSGQGAPVSSEAGFFGPFTTTKARGMGVGLSISRSIIESHYGVATQNSEGGAAFSFSLPLQNSDGDA